MNTTKRICILYESKKVLVVFDEHDSIPSIITASLHKLKLSAEKPSEYNLILEKFGCINRKHQ